MSGVPSAPEATISFLARADLDRLIQALRAGGRRLIGPTVSDGAIVYDEIRDAASCPMAGATSRGRGTTV